MEGRMDYEEAVKQFGPEMADRMKAESDKLRTAMSPKGELNLPPMLDERRLAYGIPDSAFKVQPIFDRCIVWQLPPEQDTFSADSKILMPDTTKARQQEENPRCLLLAAGPAALDALESNGVFLGHIVMIIDMAPFSAKSDIRDGKEERVTIVSCTDVVGSEDLRDSLRRGHMKFRVVDAGGGKYRYGVVDVGVSDVDQTVEMHRAGGAQNPRFMGEEA